MVRYKAPNTDHAGILAFGCHTPKIFRVVGNDQPFEFHCLSIYFCIRQANLFQIVLNVLDIKPLVELRKVGTGRKPLIQKQFMFIQPVCHAGYC